MTLLKRIGARVRGANWVFWASLAGLLIGWQLLADGIESSLILVPPTEVWDRGVDMWKNEELLTDIRVSGLEFVLGFGAGSLVGIVVGIVTGNSRSAARLVDPYVSGFYAVPILALAPLFIIALGLGILSKVVVVAFVVFFPMVFVTSAGVRATEASYRELGRAFHLTPLATVVKVLLPSSVPYVLSGLRVAAGRGLTAVLGAELFGAKDGLGLLIFNAASEFDTAGVYVGIVLFALAGVAVTKFFFVLERKVAPWRELQA